MIDLEFIRQRWRAALRLLRAEGPTALGSAIGSAWRRERAAVGADYPGWVREHPYPPVRVEALAHSPLVSVVMPVRDTPAAWLRAAIDSVRAQTYPHWELCIADDASTAPHVRAILDEYRAKDPRVKVAWRDAAGNISAASNSALALAGGELVAFLDHDDELAPHALARVAAEAEAHPDAAMFYSDEDKLDPRGERAHPNFKPDWNPELFLSHNIAAHLAAYRADAVRSAGGLREGFEGAQDYDLALRVAEAAGPARIRHIPEVLYHWRMVPGSTAITAFEKDYAAERARRAVAEHLARTGVAASVESLDALGAQRIRYPLPEGPPRWEVLRADTGADGARARNRLAAKSSAEYLVFLSPGVAPEDGAIEELVAHAHREGIGAVGGRLWSGGRVLHAGVVAGAGYAHRGLGRGDPGYMMRAGLAQAMSIVSGDCLCVARRHFDAAGGFDEALDRAFHDVDFGLRLGRMGLRNVFTPFADFRIDDAAQALPVFDAVGMGRFSVEAGMLRARWAGELAADPAYNPNLSLETPFALARPPRRERVPA